MSCKECSKVQKENREGKNLAYLRVNYADVLIGACNKHFIELKEKMGILDFPSVVYRIKGDKL